MQPNAEMSYCHVAIGLAILVCGCISEPSPQGLTSGEPAPVTIIRNVTFANNTIDESSCYVMVNGVCMDEEMGLR